MIDFSGLSSELFQILRAFGKNIVLYSEDGQRVFEPTDAQRFYLTDDNILINVVKDGDNSSLRIYLSDTIILSSIRSFLATLRNLATTSNLLFHVKKFDREIKPQDFATKGSLEESSNSSTQHTERGYTMTMNLMEGLYGTSRSSYLKMENARMIIRHSARISENQIGSRGRHIDKIFIENAEGERVLFPLNMISGARAMTQHVNQGGTFQDAVSQQIVRIAKDFSNLANVAQHLNTTAQQVKAEVGIHPQHTMEARGVKGPKARPWAKTFRDEPSMKRWCFANNAVTQETTAINGLDDVTESFRVSVMEKLAEIRTSFDRMSRPQTYLNEAQTIKDSMALMENGEQAVDLVPLVESAKEFLNFDSYSKPNFSDEVFESVVRLIEGGYFSQTMDRAATSVVNPQGSGMGLPSSTPTSTASGSQSPDHTQDNSGDDKDDSKATTNAGSGYKNSSSGPNSGQTNQSNGSNNSNSSNGNDDDNDQNDDQQNESESLVPGMENNATIKEFGEWLASFDPDDFLTRSDKYQEVPGAQAIDLTINDFQPDDDSLDAELGMRPQIPAELDFNLDDGGDDIQYTDDDRAQDAWGSSFVRGIKH